MLLFRKNKSICFQLHHHQKKKKKQKEKKKEDEEVITCFISCFISCFRRKIAFKKWLFFVVFKLLKFKTTNIHLRYSQHSFAYSQHPFAFFHNIYLHYKQQCLTSVGTYDIIKIEVIKLCQKLKALKL